MGELGFCTIKDIINLVSQHIGADIAADTGIPFTIIRFLHNKPFYFIFFFLKCYFQYLDVVQIDRFLPILIIPLVFGGLIGKIWRKMMLTILLLFPLILIFNPLKLNLQSKILTFQGFYIFFGITSFVKLLLPKLTK